MIFLELPPYVFFVGAAVFLTGALIDSSRNKKETNVEHLGSLLRGAGVAMVLLLLLAAIRIISPPVFTFAVYALMIIWLEFVFDGSWRRKICQSVERFHERHR